MGVKSLFCLFEVFIRVSKNVIHTHAWLQTSFFLCRIGIQYAEDLY